MKILVTGATGFIGGHVIPALLERGHAVTALARDARRARGFEWFDHVNFMAFDCHRYDDAAMESFGQQDAAIHLAWPGLPDYKALFHFERNLWADYRFLKSLVQSGIGRLLVTGTCLEYGMQGGCLTEDMSTQPVISYALAKDSLRKFLQALQHQHPFTLQWARLFYMYGPGQNANSLLPQLDQAIAHGEPVFNMSGGDQLRDYLPVQEVAIKLVSLVEHPACEGVVNICSGEAVSVRRLAEQHLAQRGAKMALNLGYYPYPDFEPMEFWGGTRKYRRYCEDV